MMGCGFNFTLISSKTETLFTPFSYPVLDTSEKTYEILGLFEIQRMIRRTGQRRELASRLKTIILAAWRKRLLLKTVGLTCRSARTRGSASRFFSPTEPEIKT
jgi:hypothetical protein